MADPRGIKIPPKTSHHWDEIPHERNTRDFDKDSPSDNSAHFLLSNTFDAVGSDEEFDESNLSGILIYSSSPSEMLKELNKRAPTPPNTPDLEKKSNPPKLTDDLFRPDRSLYRARSSTMEDVKERRRIERQALQGQHAHFQETRKKIGYGLFRLFKEKFEPIKDNAEALVQENNGVDVVVQTKRPAWDTPGSRRTI